MDLGEVGELIVEALVESRTKVLPALYKEMFNPVRFGPVRNIECIESKRKTVPGTLAAAWPPPWTGSMPQIRQWEVLLNNNGITYKTKGPECSVRVPGFKPGTEIVLFVRPIGKDGSIGDWGDAGKCTV